MWGGTHTGLVVHERLINCPQELAAPLLQALFDEVAWATEDEPNEQVLAPPRSGSGSGGSLRCVTKTDFLPVIEPWASCDDHWQLQS